MFCLFLFCSWFVLPYQPLPLNFPSGFLLTSCFCSWTDYILILISFLLSGVPKGAASPRAKSFPSKEKRSVPREAGLKKPKQKKSAKYCEMHLKLTFWGITPNIWNIQSFLLELCILSLQYPYLPPAVHFRIWWAGWPECHWRRNSEKPPKQAEHLSWLLTSLICKSPQGILSVMVNVLAKITLFWRMLLLVNPCGSTVYSSGSSFFPAFSPPGVGWRY